MTTPLADRLRTAFGSSLRATIPPTREPSPPPHSDRERFEWDRRLHDAATLPGVELETEAGPCLLHEERYSLGHPHGGDPLAACLTLPHRALALLARDLSLGQFDFRDAVFLDTETTGLAGGTGTTAFLVGIGYFETGAFVVRQYFMRDFAEERALLLALAEALAPFRYAVTFNGKSFDLPLLETRYVLARLSRRRWQPERHLDLLHPARRLWRERLPSCSLASLEEAILGHRRLDDVPSWAIPGLYTAYLQTGQAGSLGRVFGHNRHDLLSLVALVTQLGRRLAEPLEHRLPPDELLAVARLYEDLGLRAEAAECLELALEQACSITAAYSASLQDRIRLTLAFCHKRAGRRERAYELWRELARGPAAIRGLIELAKHHEHQVRDLIAALDCVEQALNILELREARDGPHPWRWERLDLERRLARLLRKRGHVM